jgi:hypothetical protein
MSGWKNNFTLKEFTVFLLILKRDRDRRIHERPHENAQG